MLRNSRKSKGSASSEYFDCILISEIEEIRKPDAEIFNRAAAHMNVPVEESIFVGDNPEADIAGAQAVGMQAIWKRDSYWKEPSHADAIVDELMEIPDVVDAMRRRQFV